MQTVQLLAKKLSPVIGKEKANMILYRYNSIPDYKRKMIFLDNLKLVCYRQLGPDFEDKILLNPPDENEISRQNVLGEVTYNENNLYPFGLSNNELLMHTAILGRTGSGKTNIVYNLIRELKKNEVPFLIFDWKKNYRNLLSQDKNILVFTPGSKASPLYFNPLIPPAGIDPKVWKEFIVYVIGYSYFIGEGALTLIENALDKAYSDYGIYDGNAKEYPTFIDVSKNVWAKGMKRGREMLWQQSSTRTLHALTKSTLAESINVKENVIPIDSLLEKNVIIELDYLSPPNKIFLTQALLLWIYFNNLNKSKKEELNNMIIIEEAQNLLLKGKEEIKSGNIMPKIIREFRELGIGLTFVAQEVSKMNTTALQNTYTLIALNQRYRKDIEVLGSSMSLRFDEWDYLGKLPVGTALLNMKGSFPGSFQVKFPLAKVNAEITDEDIEKSMKENFHSLFNVNLEEIRVKKNFQVFSEQGSIYPPRSEKTEKTHCDEDLLLLEIFENPHISITNHYKNLGMNYRVGNILKKSLIEKGYIFENSVSTNNSRMKILHITDMGKDYLSNTVVNVKSHSSKGGDEHEIWKKKIKNHLENIGYEVKEEVPITELK